MKTKMVIISIIIIAILVLSMIMVFYNTNSGTPQNLRVTFLGNKIFVRWSSSEPTLGEISINGKLFKENSTKLFHKLLVVRDSAKYMTIKEFKDNSQIASYNIDLSEIKNSSLSVGVYIGEGVDSLSYNMVTKYFENMGFSVTYLISNNFDNLTSLFKYDIIVFPGGRSDLMLKGLTTNEILNLRKYVAAGGSYMGICAGAYFASKYVVWHGSTYPYPLGLFDGKAVGPIVEIGNYNTNNPYNPQYPTNITWFDGKVFNVIYWGGPYFTPTNNVFVLAEYNKVHKPAAIRFKYDNGRVILFGFHPELNSYYSKENREEFLKEAKIEMMWLAGL